MEPKEIVAVEYGPIPGGREQETHISVVVTGIQESRLEFRPGTRRENLPKAIPTSDI